MNQPTLAALEAARKKSVKLNIDAAYCLAKAMHHTKAAEFYLLPWKREPTSFKRWVNFLSYFLEVSE